MLLRETTGSERITPQRKVIVDKICASFPDRKIARVLLINPPQIPSEFFNPRIAKSRRYFAYPPYGMAVLRKKLVESGYEVRLLDLNYQVLSLATETGDEVSVAETWKKALKVELESCLPDLVGLSCMFTMTHTAMIEISQYIRQEFPTIPIMAGGVHSTNAPEIVLRDARGSIDLIAMFEGDDSFPEFLSVVNGDRPVGDLTQLAVLTEQGLVAIDERKTPKDLDAIPDFGDLPLDKYSDLGEVGAYRFWWKDQSVKAATVLANRGCRARCTFCSVRNFNGVSVRGRDPVSVVDEIERLKENYNIGHFMWLDDDLFFNAERTVQLFSELAKRKLDMTWDASNGIIASATTPEIIHAAAESGCIGLHFGVESGNTRILREIRKPSGIHHFLKAGKLLKQYPQIFTKGFLIIGFPNETLAMMLDTIKLAVDMALDWYTVQILTPLPSTDIYNTMVQMGLIEAGSLDTRKTNYGTSQTGKQQDREERERLNAREFYDYFRANLDVIPTREELNDIWFLMDYKINYEPLIGETDPHRLKKMRSFLWDVCDRMTRDNPIPNYFLALVSDRMGLREEAAKRHQLAQNHLASSAYWQTRFQTLGLDVNKPLSEPAREIQLSGTL